MVHRHVPSLFRSCASSVEKNLGVFVTGMRIEKMFEICLEKIWFEEILLFDLIIIFKI